MKLYALISLLTLVSGNEVGDKKNLRIVGGTLVKDAKQYPFMVSLQERSKHTCGGVLIHGNMILSAAHCANDIKDKTQWKALLNRYDQSVLPPEQEGATIHNVIEIHIHPQFELKQAKNDISIWKIDAPFKQESGIIYDRGYWATLPKAKFLIMGWGLTTDNGMVSDKLQEVVLPIMDFNKCKSIFSKNKVELNKDSQFCAGDLKGKDACEGDSGGPVIVANNKQHILVGIVSYGIKCGSDKYPGVYTKVSHHLGYIGHIVKLANPEFKLNTS